MRMNGHQISFESGKVIVGTKPVGPGVVEVFLKAKGEYLISENAVHVIKKIHKEYLDENVSFFPNGFHAVSHMDVDEVTVYVAKRHADDWVDIVSSFTR